MGKLHTGRRKKSSSAVTAWWTPTMVKGWCKNAAARVQNEALSVSAAFAFRTYYNTHQDVKLNMGCVSWHTARFQCDFLLLHRQPHKEYNSFLVLEIMLKSKVEWRWKAVSVLKSVIKKKLQQLLLITSLSEMMKPHYAHTSMATHKKCLGDIFVYNENDMKSFYSSKHSELATCYILYVEPHLITSWYAAV